MVGESYESELLQKAGRSWGYATLPLSFCLANRHFYPHFASEIPMCAGENLHVYWLNYHFYWLMYHKILLIDIKYKS